MGDCVRIRIEGHRLTAQRHRPGHPARQGMGPAAQAAPHLDGAALGAHIHVIPGVGLGDDARVREQIGGDPAGLLLDGETAGVEQHPDAIVGRVRAAQQQPHPRPGHGRVLDLVTVPVFPVAVGDVLADLGSDRRVGHIDRLLGGGGPRARAQPGGSSRNVAVGEIIGELLHIGRDCLRDQVVPGVIGEAVTADQRPGAVPVEGLAQPVAPVVQIGPRVVIIGPGRRDVAQVAIVIVAVIPAFHHG